MSVTPERLAEKRLRAEQLRQEITMLEFASREDLVSAELASQDAALDEEIARLELQKNEKIEIAVRQSGDGGGGSVAEALAAMEAAQAAEAKPEAESVPTLPSVRPALAAPTNTEGEGK